MALRAQLAKAMARQPAKAKVLAATLAREFPAQYPADWLIQVYQALDRQLRVGQLIGQLQAAFVSAPAKAKGSPRPWRASSRRSFRTRGW